MYAYSKFLYAEPVLCFAQDSYIIANLFILIHIVSVIKKSGNLYIPQLLGEYTEVTMIISAK